MTHLKQFCSVRRNFHGFSIGFAAVLCAVTLVWVLSTQDRTEVFESDPTTDLPAMHLHRTLELQTYFDAKPEPAGITPPQFDLAPPPSWLADAIDGTRTLVFAFLWWLTNNPATAGPQVPHKRQTMKLEFYSGEIRLCRQSDKTRNQKKLCSPTA